MSWRERFCRDLMRILAGVAPDSFQKGPSVVLWSTRPYEDISATPSHPPCMARAWTSALPELRETCVSRFEAEIGISQISVFDAAQLEREIRRKQRMGRATQAGNQQKEPIAMLRRQGLSQTYRMDPRYIEYQEARRSTLLRRLKASYADQGDTFGWAMIVWSASIIALSPFLGMLAAAVLSIAIALAWAGVHRVRHI